MKRRIGVVATLALVVLSAVGLAQAEVVQNGGVRATFEGELAPNRLPRSSQAPVHVSVSAKVAFPGGKPQPMRRISIAINKYGHLHTDGLPICRLDQIQPATTQDALAVCRRSLIGQGRFLANVQLRGQAPFPNDGKVYAFNGELHGKPAILAHVYGTQPAPASFTLAFAISRSRGTFGTILEAKLPPVKEGAGYITGIYLSLGKSFTSHGKRTSYLTASCPTPKDLDSAVFPFAKASVGFQSGRDLSSVLLRTCKVKG